MVITSGRPLEIQENCAYVSWRSNNDRLSPADPSAARTPSFCNEAFVFGSETILSFLLDRRPQKHGQLSPGVKGPRGKVVSFFLIVSEGLHGVHKHATDGSVTTLNVNSMLRLQRCFYIRCLRSCFSAASHFVCGLTCRSWSLQRALFSTYTYL